MLQKSIHAQLTINNGCNKQVVHILREDHDGKFLLKGSLISSLPNPVELSHKWVFTNLKYQDPEFYTRLFDESG